MIAGKIIPAIATTTASVTGLIMIEFLKLMQDKPLEDFKNSSNSLGMNLYLFQEPMPPQKAKDEYDAVMMEEVKTYPKEFTKWNKIVIDKGKLTVEGKAMQGNIVFSHMIFMFDLYRLHGRV